MLRSSSIFNAKQQALQVASSKTTAAKDKEGSEASEAEADEEYEALGREKVDLTVEQS